MSLNDKYLKLTAARSQATTLEVLSIELHRIAQAVAHAQAIVAALSTAETSSGAEG
jgi:hypothetical protein